MPESTILHYAAPQPIARHSTFLMLAVSLGMAFAFAITFVVVMTLTLPKTDGAYGQMPFHDPLVFPVMAIGASVAGLIVFPFFYFAIRSKPLTKSVTVITSVVLAELVLLTPFNAGLGFVGSFVAFAIGLILARWLARGIAPERDSRS